MANCYDEQPTDAIVVKKAATEGQQIGDAETGKLGQQQDSRSAGQNTIKRIRKGNNHCCKTLNKTSK